MYLNTKYNDISFKNSYFFLITCIQGEHRSPVGRSVYFGARDHGLNSIDSQRDFSQNVSR